MLDDNTIKHGYDQVLTGEKSSYSYLFSESASDPSKKGRTERRKDTSVPAKKTERYKNVIGSAVNEPEEQELVEEKVEEPEENSATRDIYINRTTEDERVALRIIRYAIEYYLGWSPEEAWNGFCLDTVRFMKLETAMEHIDFPEECFTGGDCSYVISLLYPEFRYDSDESVIREYEKEFNGYSHNLPKNFYTDLYGKVRAKTVLRYILSKYVLFPTPVEAYLFFYSPQVKKFLANYHLEDACRENYGGIAVKYLNDVLPKDIQKASAPIYEEMIRRLEEQIERTEV